MRIAAAFGVFLLAAVPAGAEPGDKPGPAIRTALEFFDSEDADRDIRVITLTAGIATRPRALVATARAGLAATAGTRIVQVDESLLEREADGVGLSLGGEVRWAPWSGGGIAPFLEAGLGLLLTAERFPPGGTQANITWRTGAGLRTRIGDDFQLALAIRTLHISNGRGFDVSSNPSYDGVGILLEIIPES